MPSFIKANWTMAWSFFKKPYRRQALAQKMRAILDR